MKLLKLCSLVLIGIGLVMPASATAEDPAISYIPFIRMYNPLINDHFYTSSREEATIAQNSHGYRLEGEIGYLWPHSAAAGGSESVYRLWNPRASKHFYTTDDAEAIRAVQSGFVREGIVGYIATASLSVNDPIVYRLYNSTLQKHFYTTNKQEADAVVANLGYVLEGRLGTKIFAKGNN